MPLTINNIIDTKIDHAKASITSAAIVKVDKLGRVYATGRRKTAVARVWIKTGKAILIVHKLRGESYFTNSANSHLALEPFRVTNNLGKFDVMCTVDGSGKSGQAGAIKHGIARALDKIDPNVHTALRKTGCLTRDSRQVERKKYGLSGARKSYQFSKR
jgi:small subunit ribosomal protein S9